MGRNIGAIPAEYMGNVYATTGRNDIAIPQAVPITHPVERKGKGRDRFPGPMVEVHGVAGTTPDRFFPRTFDDSAPSFSANQTGNLGPSIMGFLEFRERVRDGVEAAAMVLLFREKGVDNDCPVTAVAMDLMDRGREGNGGRWRSFYLDVD